MSKPVPTRLLRWREVVHLTGLPRPSIYVLMKLGRFPLTVYLGNGTRSVAWREDEVRAWIAEQIKSADKNRAVRKRQMAGKNKGGRPRSKTPAPVSAAKRTRGRPRKEEVAEA